MVIPYLGQYVTTGCNTASSASAYIVQIGVCRVEGGTDPTVIEGRKEKRKEERGRRKEERAKRKGSILGGMRE